MMLAARLLAKTGVDVLRRPQLVITAKNELLEAQGPEFRYAALLGDRLPPLDYRK